MKIIYFMLLLVNLNCCSYSLVKPYNTRNKSCTKNYIAPVTDTGLVTLGTIITLGLGFTVYAISGLSSKPVPKSAYFVVGGSAVGTIYIGNSMTYGYKEVSKCRDINNDSNK
tara:strand:+ start:462 stop:797 length:336 start_codon:yes stop_codon:yes gene_type:complete